MSDETNDANPNGRGGFERRDVGIAGVLYFLLGLAVLGFVASLVVTGLFHYLDKRTEAQQTPVSPLVTNAPKDTRHLPPEYNGNYQQYLQKNFPSPQLEIDERTELNKDRLREEQTLSTYDWVDQNAGTVRIPIDRAMDLIVQRGLPVRTQATNAAASAAQPPQPEAGKRKGNKK
ncbi:MAG: hypothetical protein ACLQBK_27650 [Candidatus Sulfotelmatobacter sp.]